MRPKLVFLLLLLSILGGCRGACDLQVNDFLPPVASADDLYSWVFFCPDQVFSARFSGQEVRLDFGDRVFSLPQVRAASGARYQKGDKSLFFWNKGHMALLGGTDGAMVSCRGTPAKSAWEDAALRGVSLRAFGQEPGWLLEIVEGDWMRLQYDYGQEFLFSEHPQRVQRGPRQLIYCAQEHQAGLRVKVEEDPCTDVMSGEKMPLRVTVRFGDRVLSGCGRWLDRTRGRAR